MHVRAGLKVPAKPCSRAARKGHGAGGTSAEPPKSKKHLSAEGHARRELRPPLRRKSTGNQRDKICEPAPCPPRPDSAVTSAEEFAPSRLKVP
jgi:hypothetical protein